MVASVEAAGIPCWIAPRDIPPGADYADVIAEAVIAADAFVCLLSEASLSSRHCQAELRLAFDGNISILAVDLDGAPVTGGRAYYIGQSQRLDARRSHAEWGPDATAALARMTGGVGGPSPRAGSTGETTTGVAPASASSTRQDTVPSRKPRSPRSEMYAVFWSRYLERVQAEHPSWTRTRVTPSKSWITMPGPQPGMQLVPQFSAGGWVGHHLYLDTGERASTEDLYGRLAQARVRFEASYGRELDWRALPDRRACRIVDDVRGTVDELDRHEEMIEWMIDAGVRMRSALTDWMSTDAQAPHPPQEGRVRPEDFAAALAAGSAEAQELDDRLATWARAHGVAVVTGPKSRTLKIGDRSMARLYPQWDVLALQLKSLIGEGDSGTAAEIRNALASIEPGTTAAVEPNISCPVAIASWDVVADEILLPFAQALATLESASSATSASPPPARRVDLI